MHKSLPYIGTAALLAVAGACGGHARSGAIRPSPAPPAQGAPMSPAAVAAADSGRPAYTKADVDFISGMIGHHAQAVVMAGWAPTHGAGPAVAALCERIKVAQTDEIAFMQRWLRERHEFVPPADPRGRIMPGMSEPMLMHGMLTPAQMTELDNARGAEFDRLFLTYMIMHHQGAVDMVKTLLAHPGAAQDDLIFRFASDVNIDQTTEIQRMTRMLDAMSASGK